MKNEIFFIFFYETYLFFFYFLIYLLNLFCFYHFSHIYRFYHFYRFFYLSNLFYIFSLDMFFKHFYVFIPVYTKDLSLFLCNLLLSILYIHNFCIQFQAKFFFDSMVQHKRKLFYFYLDVYNFYNTIF
jgi:hypothetical protein